MTTPAQQELIRAAYQNDLLRMQDALQDPSLDPSGEVLESLLNKVVHAETFAVLLDSGWSPNLRRQYGNCPILTLATREGRVDIATLLLDRGADPNLVDEVGSSAVAASCGNRSSRHVACLRLLLDRGADPNVGKIYSPLTWACTEGAPEQVKILLEFGVDPDRWYRRGNALSVAIDDNKLEIAKLLLEWGADPTLVIPEEADLTFGDHGAVSLSELAKKLKRKKIVELLEGANLHPQSPTFPVALRWAEITKELRELGVEEIADLLNTGANRTDIVVSASALELQLPDDVIDSWEIHDGQPFDAGLFYYDDGSGMSLLDDESSLFRLIPSGEWAEEIESLRSMQAEVDETDEAFQADDGVVPAFWTEGWLPLARNLVGDVLCCDTVPASGGKLGQIILLSSEDPIRRRIATSWAECLQKLSVGIDNDATED